VALDTIGAVLTNNVTGQNLSIGSSNLHRWSWSCSAFSLHSKLCIDKASITPVYTNAVAVVVPTLILNVNVDASDEVPCKACMDTFKVCN